MVEVTHDNSAKEIFSNEKSVNDKYLAIVVDETGRKTIHYLQRTNDHDCMYRFISTHETFPRTENLQKIIVLKLKVSDEKFVSANHILQNFLFVENVQS